MFLSPITFLPKIAASPATSSSVASHNDCIFWRQFMTVLAIDFGLTSPRNVSFALPQSSADSASPSLSYTVFWRQFVTAFAICSSTLWSTASCILFWRDSFEMSWIATKRRMAQMINFVSFTNWTDKQFVDESMQGCCSITNANAAVMGVASVFRTSPKPASRSGFEMDSCLNLCWQIRNRESTIH